MKVQLYEDHFIEEIAAANFDAFLADLKNDGQQLELSKSLKESRDADELEHFFQRFDEDMTAARFGRTGTGPVRLRSERPDESESEWVVGDPDVDKGLNDGGELRKRD